MVDEFLTLEKPSAGYFMDRGSKFLAYASPVLNENDAHLFLQKVKKDHPKARHFCTAFRLLPDASIERSNDDGEPSGSAGRPILGQLIKNQLTNSMVVVARYFGGTKLGVPGLIEAYKISSANAIGSAIISKQKIYKLVRMEMPYEKLPLWINHLKENNIPVLNEHYNDNASISVCFRQSSYMDDLIDTLKQYSQLDFNNIEAYANHLDLKIELLNEELIK